MYTVLCSLALEFTRANKPSEGEPKTVVSSLTKKIQLPSVPVQGQKIIFEPAQSLGDDEFNAVIRAASLEDEGIMIAPIFEVDSVSQSESGSIHADFYSCLSSKAEFEATINVLCAGYGFRKIF